MIHAGSHSRLKVFQSCRRHAKYKYVDKLPEPDRGPPERHKISKLYEHANDRGNRLHTNGEHYTIGKIDTLHPELSAFQHEYDTARILYRKRLAVAEQNWYFDSDFTPLVPEHEGDKRIYFRAKLDLLVEFKPEHMLAVDLKTGGLFGREIEYAVQIQDYACLTALRFPKVEIIDTELWFPDHNDIKHMRFTRAQALRVVRGLKMRMDALTSETKFPPTANKFSCRYCMYGPKYDGPCKEGMQ